MRSTTKRSDLRMRILHWSLLSSLILGGSTAHAHFLWIIAETEGGAKVVHAFLNESPVPDLPEYMRHIENARFSIGGKPVERTRAENTFVLKLTDAAAPSIEGDCDLGVISRKGETIRLYYTARLQRGLLPLTSDEDEQLLRVRCVRALGPDGEIVVAFNGKPVPNATVKLYREDGSTQEQQTDAEGRAVCAGLAEGKTGVLAKWADGIAGERDGQAFVETRYYATLIVDPAPSSEDALYTAESAFHLPEAVNSFGGATLGDWLYIYSGHVGQTHKYHVGTTSKHFRRVHLRNGTVEELPMGPGLQGVTLSACGGKLYRVGGMAAHNAEGEPNDLRSVADFACFDPETRTWSELAPLPSPRSTHDAVVIGKHLYVVGGWNMPGGDSAEAAWHTDALRFDLSRPNAQWETVPTPPFALRALAAASLDGKLYVLGGLSDAGEVVRTVYIFDPTTNGWSSGPYLPGEKRVGFAPSAFEVNGRLYVSTSDGLVHRLGCDGTQWETVAQLKTSRTTHRLLPEGEDALLVVGGTHAMHPTASVERIPLTIETAR